jgi:hypothetical protein
VRIHGLITEAQRAHDFTVSLKISVFKNFALGEKMKMQNYRTKTTFKNLFMLQNKSADNVHLTRGKTSALPCQYPPENKNLRVKGVWTISSPSSTTKPALRDAKSWGLPADPCLPEGLRPEGFPYFCFLSSNSGFHVLKDKTV